MASLGKANPQHPIYPFIYRSYWHYLLHSKQSYALTHDMYFAARPNPGAGIGHQMANWIAGYWWSQQLNLNFAHMPFSTSQWDDFLGFGHNEISVKELQRRGYKLRRLPISSKTIKRPYLLLKDNSILQWTEGYILASARPFLYCTI